LHDLVADRLHSLSNHANRFASRNMTEITGREGRFMQKQEGKIGAIRRNVQGKACYSCGSRSYQLVLQSANERHVGKLFARCQHCHRARDIGEDLERILWM
jgi:hypothetical protein